MSSPNSPTRKTDVVAMLRRLAAPPAEQETAALPRYEIELELRRHHQAFEAEREAQRQGEHETASPPEPIVNVVRAALSGNAPAKDDSSVATSASATVALNDITGLLRSALGG